LAGLVILSPERETDQAYSRDYQRLLDSLGETRPVEARVTGETVYRRYRPPSRLPSDRTIRDRPAIRGAFPLERTPRSQVPAKIALAIQEAGARKPSPENRAAVAVLDLVEGSPGSAVTLLREANVRKPADPRLLNDLAAALLAVSQETGDPWPSLEAIDATQRALRLKPSPAVLFNRALALEHVGLRARAASAWRRYLDQDSRSGWAEEAARRLDRLEQEASVPAELTQNLWAIRQRGERILLSRWAEQTLAGHTPEADATLDRAEALAATLSAGGSRLLTASIAAIREAATAGDEARQIRLARGHQAYSQAFSLWRQEKNGAALHVLEGSIQDLRSAQSPFELSARVLRARVVSEPDWAELRSLDSTAVAMGFPTLAAEVRWIISYRMSLEGRLAAAVVVCRDARQRFDGLGEREMSAVLAAMLAELLDALDRKQESAVELAAALAAGPWVSDPWNRYSIYVVAASPAIERFSRAAVELRLEAADVCRDLPERPLCAVDSWLWAAAITPDADLAGDALQQAGELLLAAPDSDGKVRTQIDLGAARARWLAQDGRSADAEELYRKTAESYEAGGLAISAARARSSRAQILQSLGRSDEAAAEFRSGLQIFRRWDQSDRFRPENAAGYSPRELREVYEHLIAIELSTGGGEPYPAAFLLSEEMRDRLAPRPRWSPEIRLPERNHIDLFTSAVPAGTAVVEYALSGKRAMAWILAGGHLGFVLLTPQTQLSERIRSLAQERHTETWKRISGALFRDLLAPVLERLPAGTERLVLVPDSELYGLPFRALWDSASGRYLDESYTLTLAPSVRQVLGFGEDRHAAPAQPGQPILSLGLSTFDTTLGLDPLPWASQEAADVRKVYGNGLGDCPGTDWAGFRGCADEAGILHLATHAAADSTRSDRTWLAFERETVSLDRLWEELPVLSQRPLVVLSACQSVAVAGGGEGLGGLARPFLAKGARAVVGTLWKIDDREAARVFPAFHRAFHDSGDAAGALRATREALKDWAEKPWVWGAIEMVSAEL
jgi:tetratricopeptide (TPR) repeat protein